MADTTRTARISPLMVITALVMMLLFLGLVSLLVLQRQSIPTSEEEKRAQRLKNLTELRAQAEVLHQYHWVDRAQGIVGLPIERAMELVQKELADSKPRPAGPIQPAAQPAAPGPPQPGATPAGGGSAPPPGRKPQTGGQP
jgi:hypothetical protein